MTIAKYSIFLLCAASLGLNGCASFSRATGSTKNGPDEFRVLTKAPLVVPPEYNLLPPRPGEQRPQDLAAAQAVRVAMLGGNGSGVASAGEKTLVATARGNLDETAIRARLDAETNSRTAKSKGFSNRILFWRDGDTYVEAGTMLDADAEAERLRRHELGNSATGGGVVVIRKTGRSKLPGL